MARLSSAVLALGMNPAWQVTLGFSNLAWGNVNRAVWREACGGGKGVNFARAARLLGRRVGVALFAGGDSGGLVLDDLRQMGAEPLPVQVPAPTRQCTTVADLGSGQVTELIEPSAPVPADALAAMREVLRGAAGNYQALAVCGSLPPGADASLYTEAVAGFAARNLPVLADVAGDTGAAVCAAGAHIAKINRAELAGITGADDPAQGVRLFMERFPVRLLVVTAGAGTVLAQTRGGGSCEWRLPEVQPLVNPIGAGDCTAAVLLHRILECLPDGDARQWPADAAVFACTEDALACASASCLEAKPAVFQPGRAAELRPVRVQ